MLEVGRALTVEEGGLAVFDRHLGDDRRERVEPERHRGSAADHLPAVEQQDELVAVGAQVAHERIARNRGHCFPRGGC
jgi:hypothetical protein